MGFDTKLKELEILWSKIEDNYQFKNMAGWAIIFISLALISKLFYSSISLALCSISLTFIFSSLVSFKIDIIKGGFKDILPFVLGYLVISYLMNFLNISLELFITVASIGAIASFTRFLMKGESMILQFKETLQVAEELAKEGEEIEVEKKIVVLNKIKEIAQPIIGDKNA